MSVVSDEVLQGVEVQRDECLVANCVALSSPSSARLESFDLVSSPTNLSATVAKNSSASISVSSLNQGINFSCVV